MDERLLQIRDYQGEGFRPIVGFGAWRVAVLRPRADTRAEGITMMERHNQTDEVFVLIRGKGVLLLGGNGPQLEGVLEASMEHGKIYNVRCNVWHAVLLDRDASVLIVENRETGTDNSEYLPLTAAQRSLIREIEQREAPG
jgi:ureidoglycolate hydrolase